ncbi:MAG: branched-chain amino acid ABC transporter permease [Desulfobacteraceae bacterium]|nr:branched-chain amino acid ABC transporter permease [Desulfobacteraceae bacterium]
MDIFLQLMVSGIAVGGVYALIALGFVLIYKATSVINFATGEFMMVGAYICLTLLTYLKIPFAFVLVFTLAFAFMMGIVIERLILRPLIGEPIISVIMVTIGLSSILKGLAHMIWTADFRSFPEILPAEPWNLGFAIVPSALKWGFIFAIIGVIVFTVIFKYTRLGIAMRANASDQQVAQSMGINTKIIFALSWSFAACAAAIGGIVIGNISGIHPNLGHVGLMVLPVVILGGLDSIGGAIVGGFIIGILENLAGGYIDPILPGFKEIAPFIVLVFILMIRPYGLFGKKIIERV